MSMYDRDESDYCDETPCEPIARVEARNYPVHMVQPLVTFGSPLDLSGGFDGYAR